MKKRRITSLMLAATIALTPTTTLAHGGRTDSSGGHKDNKNASGLGSYHYHCGGNPARLHKDGVCPYSSKSTTKSTIKSNFIDLSIMDFMKEIIFDITHIQL